MYFVSLKCVTTCLCYEKLRFCTFVIFRRKIKDCKKATTLIKLKISNFWYTLLANVVFLFVFSLFFRLYYILCLSENSSKKIIPNLAKFRNLCFSRLSKFPRFIISENLLKFPLRILEARVCSAFFLSFLFQFWINKKSLF